MKYPLVCSWHLLQGPTAITALSGGCKGNGEGEMNVRETPFHAGLARSWNRGDGKRTASECLLPVMLKDERMAAAHSHLLEQDRETNSLYYYF